MCSYTAQKHMCSRGHVEARGIVLNRSSLICSQGSLLDLGAGRFHKSTHQVTKVTQRPRLQAGATLGFYAASGPRARPAGSLSAEPPLQPHLLSRIHLSLKNTVSMAVVSYLASFMCLPFSRKAKQPLHLINFNCLSADVLLVWIVLSGSL